MRKKFLASASFLWCCAHLSSAPQSPGATTSIFLEENAVGQDVEAVSSQNTKLSSGRKYGGGDGYFLLSHGCAWV